MGDHGHSSNESVPSDAVSRATHRLRVQLRSPETQVSEDESRLANKPQPFIAYRGHDGDDLGSCDF